jgi:NAD(P)-dependent dehydrogenase (short-subunit alcohol dehydrogenase family)
MPFLFRVFQAALEGRRNNIRVNSVAPGFLYTAIVAESVERAGEAGQAKWREFEARQGRRATFDEIGDAVVLISTPGMSLLNGHNLVLDK